MSSDPIAIRVRDVSKHYLLFNKPQDRLKQSIVPRLQRLAGRKPKQYYRDFAALSHVSFDVCRGETVGVIGRNGSGKSTLLQVICGTLRPNAGHVEVNGRIAALLELGTGFNPEFTGRENVYLNATILGLPRGEIDARFDNIARFADIGDFINQPVKTYSSGMYVRLAFATAINVDPDILVVDEALAVGDEAFQRKCYARIEQIQERGGTILFVTHGMQTVVQLCTRALLFDHGEMILDERPKIVVNQYHRLMNASVERAHHVREYIRALASAGAVPDDLDEAATADTAEVVPQRTAQSVLSLEGFDPALVAPSRTEYERRGAQIRSLRLLNEAGKEVNILQEGRRYTYEYHVDFSEDACRVAFGMLIKTVSGFELGGTGTHYHDMTLDHVAANSTVRVRMRFNCLLAPGTYFLNAGVEEPGGSFYHRILDAVMFRVAPEPLKHSYIIDFGIVPQLEVKPLQRRF